jgi:hypothetical protein
LGAECAECQINEERKAARLAANKPIIEQLHKIKNSLISEWRESWPGVEHGKGILGQAINRAIEELDK